MEGQLSSIVDRKIVAVAPEASVGSAKRLAQNSRVSMLPVLSNGKLVGLVEASSLSGENDAKTVGSIMQKPVFIEENGSMEDARKLITEHGLSRLPVVDSPKSMMCVGTLSSSDLI